MGVGQGQAPKDPLSLCFREGSRVISDFWVSWGLTQDLCVPLHLSGVLLGPLLGARGLLGEGKMQVKDVMQARSLPDLSANLLLTPHFWDWHLISLHHPGCEPESSCPLSRFPSMCSDGGLHVLHLLRLHLFTQHLPSLLLQPLPGLLAVLLTPGHWATLPSESMSASANDQLRNAVSRSLPAPHLCFCLYTLVIGHLVPKCHCHRKHPHNSNVFSFKATNLCKSLFLALICILLFKIYNRPHLRF